MKIYTDVLKYLSQKVFTSLGNGYEGLKKSDIKFVITASDVWDEDTYTFIKDAASMVMLELVKQDTRGPFKMRSHESSFRGPTGLSDPNVNNTCTE